jgi:hypothetical protein
MKFEVIINMLIVVYVKACVELWQNGKVLGEKYVQSNINSLESEIWPPHSEPVA